MINGTASVSRVIEESTCRSSKDYRFTEVGMYKIHSNALMPNIPFEEADEFPEEIDESIFLNDEETKLTFPTTIKCQNYLTSRFIGRAPLEFYDKNNKTKMGRQFVLQCFGGNPNQKYRAFGTEAAIRGFNRDASDNDILPGGGENT